MSQLETPIDDDDLASTREEALSDTSPEQYRLLTTIRLVVDPVSPA